MHKNLKEIRLKNNYTCKQMAEFLGISKPFYWQLENDKRTLTYNMAFKIASIFKLKPDDLFFTEYKKK